MIMMGSFRDLDPKKYDEVWVIVRSLKDTSCLQHKNVFLKQDLAPSPELFSKYLKLKGKMRWNEDTFLNIYVPQFLEELKKNPMARDAMNELFELDKRKNILLVCFCPDEELCHRFIVGSLLFAVGADVYSTTDNKKLGKYNYFYNNYIHYA